MFDFHKLISTELKNGWFSERCFWHVLPIVISFWYDRFLDKAKKSTLWPGWHLLSCQEKAPTCNGTRRPGQRKDCKHFKKSFSIQILQSNKKAKENKRHAESGETLSLGNQSVSPHMLYKPSATLPPAVQIEWGDQIYWLPKAVPKVLRRLRKWSNLKWLWIKKGYPKNFIGKRKNRPKHVVPRFSRMRSEGFSFNLGVWGWSCVRGSLFSCPQPFATVCKCRVRSLWHCRWGELRKVTFHGRVTCQFAPLFHGGLHESGMSRKKGDAFRCTGAGFRESDTFAS